jgi:hypothetical protein
MVKHTRTVNSKREIPVAYTCDICGKKYIIDSDPFETQEFHLVDFVGGYGSVFGDMAKVECDICQHCLYEMIGKNCRKHDTTDN